MRDKKPAHAFGTSMIPSTLEKNGMSKEIEKMSARLDDFVATLSKLMGRIEGDFRDLSAQSKTIQKEINKLHESISVLQKEMSGVSAGQESIKSTIERMQTPTPVPLGSRVSQDSRADGVTPTTATSSPSAATQQDSGKLKMSDYLKQKQSVFDTRVLNAFINATKETAKVLLMKESAFQRPQPLPPGKFVTFANAARMKLSKGETSGFMGVGFKEKQLLPTVAALFGITEGEVTVAMINDLVKEFCNQVFGQAKAALLKDGIEYTITYPEVALGSQLDIRRSWGDSYLALIFEMDGKEFYILFW
jgi:CheY-specific phosphatase CheX